MRLRTVGLVATAAGVATAAIWWRRRSRAAAVPPVQLGLADGSTLPLAADDPEVVAIEHAAAELRRALEVEV